MRRILLLSGILWLLVLGCAREPLPIDPPKDSPDPEPIVSPAKPPTPTPSRPDPKVAETAAQFIETTPGAPPTFAAVWQFGTLAPGAEVRHRYTITNPTKAPWTIHGVTKTCSCAAGEFSQQVVKPGETTWVEIVFKAPDREGPVQQSLVVHFVELTAPPAHLIVKGEIRRVLSVTPPSLDLGRLSARARPSREIEIRNHGAQEIELARKETPEWLKVEIAPLPLGEEKDRPRQAWKVTLHADPSKLKPGSTAGSLVIHTKPETAGPVLIPLHVERKSPLETTPDSLVFDPVEVGQTSQKVLLLDLDGEAAGLSEKELVLTHNLGDELEVRLASTTRPDRFQLTAVFKPAQSKGKVTGKLEIKSQKENVPAAQVKVFAEVR